MGMIRFAFLFLLFVFCNKIYSVQVPEKKSLLENAILSQRVERKNLKRDDYVILRKKKDLQKRVTKSNCVYEIRSKYNLQGATIVLPNYCTLKFNGGDLTNGYIISNYTKLINPTPNLHVSRTIFDIDGREINPKTYSNRKVDFKIHNSFSMFNESMSEENMDDKYNMYRDCGMNTLWLCILLEYHKSDNTVKVPTWYKKYHSLGGLKGTVRYLEQHLGVQVDCVKLHKNYFFKDTLEEPEAYSIFCKQMIDELSDLGIKKIFISNEEPERTRKGSIWVKSFNEIINYAHSKNVKVGFSMNSYRTTIESLDQSLIDGVDMLYENFYPSLSSKDLETSYDDLPRMTKYCEYVIHKSMKALAARNVVHKYGISECGIVGKVTALRYPYKYDITSEIDSTGKIIDLYWRSVIPAAINMGVKEVANWFMDEYKRDRFKESMFDFIFDSVWEK